MNNSEVICLFESAHFRISNGKIKKRESRKYETQRKKKNEDKKVIKEKKKKTRKEKNRTVISFLAI